MRRVDWYLNADDPAAASALRRHIRSHLERHCADGPQIDDAELIVQEAIANAIEHADGPVWVQLSWLTNSQSSSCAILVRFDFPPVRPHQPPFSTAPPGRAASDRHRRDRKYPTFTWKAAAACS